MTREPRIVLLEDETSSVLCFTNLCNHQLMSILCQIDSDIENGVYRGVEEICEQFVNDNAFKFDGDCYIHEFTESMDSAFDDKAQLNKHCLCDYGCYTFSVISSDIQSSRRDY